MTERDDRTRRRLGQPASRGRSRSRSSAARGSGVAIAARLLYRADRRLHRCSRRSSSPTRNMLAIGSNIAFIGLMAAAGTPLIIAGGLDLSVGRGRRAGRRGDRAASTPSRLSTSGSPRCCRRPSLGAVIGAGQRPRSTHAAAAQPADRHPRHDVASSRGAALDPHRRPHQAADGAAASTGSARAACLGDPGAADPDDHRPIIVLSVVLRRTRFGRFVYAAGGNAEASRLIGLPVERVQMILYVVSGITGAVAGIMLAAHARRRRPECRRAAPPHRHRGHHPRRHQPLWRARQRLGYAPCRAHPRHPQQRPHPHRRIELLAGRDAASCSSSPSASTGIRARLPGD